VPAQHRRQGRATSATGAAVLPPQKPVTARRVPPGTDTGVTGFSHDCLAVRQRTSSLIVPGGALVQRQVEGSALDVLNEVLTWEPPP
jgi:hypothetical protein